MRWARPSDGTRYEWTDARAGQGLPGSTVRYRSERRWLVLRTTGGKADGYAPMTDTPALFRTFADVQPTESGFLEFADAYGWLSFPVPVIESGRLTYGIPFAKWRDEHEAMRKVVAGLDALSLRGRARLLALGAVLQQDLGSQAVKTGDVEEMLRQAHWWVVRTVNTRMLASNEEGASVVTLLVQEAGRKPTLRQVPQSLLAALWLQCAQAVAGGQAFRKCAYGGCSMWFLISPEGAGKRRQAIYCSRTCNVRAWRQRHQRPQRKSLPARSKR